MNDPYTARPWLAVAALKATPAIATTTELALARRRDCRAVSREDAVCRLPCHRQAGVGCQLPNSCRALSQIAHGFTRSG